MSLNEFASAMGKGPTWAMQELRTDAVRPVNERLYPFATPTYSEETGQWDYNIVRSRFNRWLAGDDIAMRGFDVDALADGIADRAVYKMAMRMAGG